MRFHGREFIQSHVRDGELLPTEFLIPMLKTRIDEEFEMGNHCILVDGFPRNTSQAIAFREEVQYHKVSQRTRDSWLMVVVG